MEFVKDLHGEMIQPKRKYMCSISEYASVDDACKDSPGYKSGATEARLEKPGYRVEYFEWHHQGSASSAYTPERTKGKPVTFSTRMEISNKDMSLWMDLLTKNTLGEDNCSEEVAICGDFGLALGELHCLASLTPLSFKVINIVAAYLSDTESESWYLPTFFGVNWNKFHNADAPNPLCRPLKLICFPYQDIARSYEGSSKVQGWVGSAIKTCRLQKFHRRLQQCSKIFIPLHDHMSDHWYLLVLNLDERNGEILDSMPNVHLQERRMAHAREAIFLIQKVFSNEMTRTTDVYFHFPSFHIVIPEYNPIHINEAESGIYVIRHMQYHRQNWYSKFQSLDHRCLIALEIIKHPRNRVTHPNSAAVSHPRTSLKDSARNITNQVDVFSSSMALNGRKCRSHRLRRSRP